MLKILVPKVDEWKNSATVSANYSFSYILVCCVIVSSIYSVYKDEMQNLLNFIISTCEKVLFFDNERKNAFLFLVGHPIPSDATKAPIIKFLQKKMNKNEKESLAVIEINNIDSIVFVANG